METVRPRGSGRASRVESRMAAAGARAGSQDRTGSETVGARLFLRLQETRAKSLSENPRSLV